MIQAGVYPPPQVGELRTLLARAKVPPPYVIAGHSFGGLNARLFSYRHPDEVIGIVLVDAAHEDQWVRIPELREATDALTAQFGVLDRLAATGLLALAPGTIPDRGLPPEATRLHRALLAGSAYFRTATAELSVVRLSASQLRAERDSASGAAPTIVIRRGLPAPLPGLGPDEVEEMERRWRTLQVELAVVSSAGDPLVAAASGHDVHLAQPELVVDAIGTMVTRARAARSRED